ncbi:DNA polymerase III subunit beta family protein [Sphingobium sp. YC-XJ3]|uniref:DNA polymerase III subunit beta family protein n=1 Tax=Sphingobium sp. YC-XJ3 TaxID=3024245 RepID=UPI00235EFDC7|nr:hypothetical protein [Sphingobium sp. YC-XJ3]WDA37842.1 hypothetical protein PO876_06585 [Sphingobium sp. YC-XJ3]
MAIPAFAVRLDAALKVRPFISSESTRYYLNGVRIEASPNGGAVCVATDGHRMGISYDADGFVDHSLIVQIPSMIKVEKGLFLRPWLVGMLADGGNGYIAVVDGKKTDQREDDAQFAVERVEECTLRIGRAFIDGTYPDWRRVVPEMKPTDVTRAFNRRYLNSFGDFIQVTGADELSPQIIQTDDKDFIGVLMPARLDKRAMPEWLRISDQKAAA